MSRLGLLMGCCLLGIAEPKTFSSYFDDQIQSNHLQDLHGHGLIEDASLKVPELVRKYGYPVEVYEVTTRDDYILTMHRIPHGKDRHNTAGAQRPVVFMMHGILSSSADWVVMGPGKGLAYILAEEGFDVWLGNARGNRYSRSHRSLDPDEAGFWEFSWDEIGNIDVPTMIDHALAQTGKQQLHYIGHSQGTTSFFVMLSLQPQYNYKIISMNALAPVAYMTHSGPILLRAAAPFSNILNRLFTLIGINEVLPNSRMLREAGEQLCRDGATTQDLCDLAMFIVGWNSEQFNKTMVPVQLGHIPAGASARQLAHYGQNMRSKQFSRFHHSYLKNILIYGTIEAPLYDLSNIRAPVHLHYAAADIFTHIDDVNKLQFHIGGSAQIIRVPLESFNHFDFLWGIDAKTLVYDKVIDIMKSYDQIHEA
ncbi:lipase 3-like [Choristoneura fumiferana]|uniref:lipase 3-like n=1 Tax=Choristoneura fumiferana TaxID=7141 RepID=UPI003D15518B